MKRYIKCSITQSNIKSLPKSWQDAMEKLGFKQFVFEDIGAGYDEDDWQYYDNTREFDNAYLALSGNSVVIYDFREIEEKYYFADKNNLLDELQYNFGMIPADGYTAPELKYLNTLPDNIESALATLGFTKLDSNLDWYLAYLNSYIVFANPYITGYFNDTLCYSKCKANITNDMLNEIINKLQEKRRYKIASNPKADKFDISNILDTEFTDCNGLHELYEW